MTALAAAAAAAWIPAPCWALRGGACTLWALGTHRLALTRHPALALGPLRRALQLLTQRSDLGLLLRERLVEAAPLLLELDEVSEPRLALRPGLSQLRLQLSRGSTLSLELRTEPCRLHPRLLSRTAKQRGRPSLGSPRGSQLLTQPTLPRALQRLLSCLLGPPADIPEGYAEDVAPRLQQPLRRRCRAQPLPRAVRSRAAGVALTLRARLRLRLRGRLEGAAGSHTLLG